MRVALGIYRLRVTLQGIEPPILRRIEVAGQTTLAGLHYVLQAAMGWENTHSFTFHAADASVGENDELDDPELAPESISLQQLAPRVGTRLGYLYDFGDEWYHEIVFEAISEADDGSYPCLLEARRNCPPEDCGGPDTYATYLIARDEPVDVDSSMWPDEDFDPEVFDEDAARIRLETLGWAGIGSENGVISSSDNHSGEGNPSS